MLAISKVKGFFAKGQVMSSLAKNYVPIGFVLFSRCIRVDEQVLMKSYQGHQEYSLSHRRPPGNDGLCKDSL